MESRDWASGPGKQTTTLHAAGGLIKMKPEFTTWRSSLPVIVTRIGSDWDRKQMTVGCECGITMGEFILKHLPVKWTKKWSDSWRVIWGQRRIFFLT